MKETQCSLEPSYLDKVLIHRVRKQIYHSSGPGYVVFEPLPNLPHLTG